MNIPHRLLSHIYTSITNIEYTYILKTKYSVLPVQHRVAHSSVKRGHVDLGAQAVLLRLSGAYCRETLYKARVLC